MLGVLSTDRWPWEGVFSCGCVNDMGQGSGYGTQEPALVAASCIPLLFMQVPQDYTPTKAQESPNASSLQQQQAPGEDAAAPPVKKGIRFGEDEAFFAGGPEPLSPGPAGGPASQVGGW